MQRIKRCTWAGDNDLLMREYHDNEWGVPLHDDDKIFEFLCLESFQAGLSWRTILNKRENFRRAFSGFNPSKVARFDGKDVKKLMNDKGIVRNIKKIEATMNNAQRFLEVKKEFSSFSKYMWSFVGGEPIVNKIKKLSDYKPVSDQAIAFSKDLKKRGFKFLGPTTIYAHMQAVGMVDDHMSCCFRKNVTK